MTLTWLCLPTSSYVCILEPFFAYQAVYPYPATNESAKTILQNRMVTCRSFLDGRLSQTASTCIFETGESISVKCRFNPPFFVSGRRSASKTSASIFSAYSSSAFVLFADENAAQFYLLHIESSRPFFSLVGRTGKSPHEKMREWKQAVEEAFPHIQVRFLVLSRIAVHARQARLHHQ